MKKRLKEIGLVIGIILLLIIGLTIINNKNNKKICSDLNNIHISLKKLNEDPQNEEYILKDYPQIKLSGEKLIVDTNYDDIKIYDYDEVVVCNINNKLLYRGTGDHLPIYNSKQELIKTHFYTGQGLYNVETKKYYGNYHVWGEDTSFMYNSITQINPKYISVCKTNQNKSFCEFDNDLRKMNIINMNGKKMLKQDYQDIIIDSESSNYVRVKENNKYGLVDYNGKEIIAVDKNCLKKSFNFVDNDFNYYVSLKDNLITVYNKLGEIIFEDDIKSEEPLYCDGNLRSFYEGWPIVPVDNIVEENNKIIINFEYGELKIEGNKKLEIILDKNGNLISRNDKVIKNKGD